MKRIVILLLVLALVLWGCDTAPDQPATPDTPTDSGTTAPPVEAVDPEDLFSDRDQAGTYENPITVTLSGSTAACDSGAVTINGGTVTITAGGTYLLSGNLEGMVIVDVTKDEKVQLVLSGAAITSPTSAAVYIRQADKVFLTTAENTDNSLANGGSFEAVDENNIDAAIFSKEDLTLNGSGSLTITSPAGHGIVSKDELTVTGGTYTITTAGHGMTGKDSIAISGGSFHITAGKDGLQADNDEDAAFGFCYIGGGSFQITAEGDGISASASLQIDGGDFSMVSGGGSENGAAHSSGNWGGFGGGPGGMGGGRPDGRSTDTTTTTEDGTSMKGIKAGTELVINGGSFTLDCADDAVHANGSLTVTGGTFQVKTGDDGFHAEEKLTVSGSTIRVTESYEGLEALHILVSSGDIDLVCSDDGLNAAGGTDASGMGGRDQMFGPSGPGGMGGGFGAGNGSITITGGSLHINASGDGIDANGTLEISGGDTVVVGPTMGDTATLDYDTSAVISGGTFIGTGAAGMAQTFSDSKNQGVIAVQIGSAPAGTKITLTDGDGKVVLEYTPELGYNVIILSSPDMVKGQTYHLTVGTASGDFDAY